MSVQLEETSPSDIVLWEGEDNSDEEFSKEAPYGYKTDGTPKKRPGRPKGSTNSGSSVSKSGGRSKSSLEREIYECIGGDLAASIGTIAPLVAYVLDERAERTARALANIASRSPNFKKGLERALVYRDFVTLASLPPAIAVAIAVETGIIKPESSMSRRFNLYEPFLAMYGQDGTEIMPDFQVPNPIGLLS